MDDLLRPPSSTYRLQLTAGCGFRQAAGLVPYLEELGIGALYASPFLAARPGSTHGYDVVDPSRLNPELGGDEEFERLAAALRERGLGLIADVVPNHLCIGDPANRWWMDVLENGPSSPYAKFFDIDWNPPKPDLVDKVLLPVLGRQYGVALEAGEIRVSFEDGAFWVGCNGARYPLGPKTWIPVLESALAGAVSALGRDHAQIHELESILTALRHLPSRSETDPLRVRERQREKEVAKRRLSALVRESGAVGASLDAAVRSLNGDPAEPRSFGRLDALLADQAFRLAHWRVASDEINYRRFFDVNDLAAIRVEDPEVFAAVHARIVELCRAGRITGLRVDHVDGLWAPAAYLKQLKEAAAPSYLVAEKILLGDEELSPDWPVQGTTGYDFLNRLNGLFVDPAARAAFAEGYARVGGRGDPFADVVYESKKVVLENSLSSELTVLARLLDRLSEQHRASRDFTLNSLHRALAEVVACFPAYRTYAEPDTVKVKGRDRETVRNAVREAKRRNRAMDASAFDFIASVLLLEPPPGMSAEERAARREWTLRVQQLSGPVMAKGVEDTAFYRRFPLASLNEVGADPGRFGVPPDELHRWLRRRLDALPHALSATATHDTKRGEDVRLRIDALSEIPGDWFAAVERWRTLNRPLRTPLDGADAPDPDDEYLLYQTLVGVWPFEGGPDDALARRVEDYLLKAVREAKLRSSWISPEEEYENAVRRFVRGVLDPAGPFSADFAAFHAPLAAAAVRSGLSQTLLKIAAPGVPDFYQGSELWDFSLVDPDNRRPVDFELRRRLLASLDAVADPAELLRAPADGRVKLHVARAALRFRRAHPDLFERGAYVPLEASGSAASRVFAFARVLGGRAVVAVAARRFLAPGAAGWAGTALPLPPGAGPGPWKDLLTGRALRAVGPSLPLDAVFSSLPVALLEGSVSETP